MPLGQGWRPRADKQSSLTACPAGRAGGGGGGGRTFPLPTRVMPKRGLRRDPVADSQVDGHLNGAGRPPQPSRLPNGKSKLGQLNTSRWQYESTLAGQVIGRPGSPVLHSAEQRFSGEMNGTLPECPHVPMAIDGLALLISNHAAVAGCRGYLPVRSLSFGAPASTFHSDAHPLLLLPSRIIAPREQNDG